MHRAAGLIARRVGREEAREATAAEHDRLDAGERGVLSESETARRGSSTATGEENEEQRP
jgi:hypothetical protein